MSFVHSLRNSRLRLSIAAIGVAAVLGATALGTMAALAADTPGMHGQMDGMQGHGGPGRAMERFKAKLKLTSSQAALWDVAASKMRPPAGAREHMRDAHEQYLNALMDSSFDPRKWLVQQDQQRAEREAQMKEARSAWLAVWDSLDASQRTQVREVLFKRAQHEHHFDWAPHRGQEGNGPAAPGRDMPNAARPSNQ
jgi:Spy/CpxP family protein refolding chaperone